ncbi:hypothetical protein J6590_066276 [Homalodisca vitripennis]|nr:hypothetical protein J6590_066276 [Homalodisca vitripennis]
MYVPGVSTMYETIYISGFRVYPRSMRRYTYPGSGYIHDLGDDIHIRVPGISTIYQTIYISGFRLISIQLPHGKQLTDYAAGDALHGLDVLCFYCC